MSETWIDCIFIAMLCDGGGEGSSVSRPFSVLGAHTISFIKTLSNVKTHYHTAQTPLSSGPTKDSVHGMLNRIGFVLCHQKVLLIAVGLSTDHQLGRIRSLCSDTA